ncbi:hypothetical protein M2311_003678 [Rhizobium leguminosarum]|uniref:hypothetical protein n=2 Tax=Rhizobium TaxID=379 RepID=UPI00128FB263|nr:hypothetical protein [Rhizobium leguminosarum]MDH6273588.1 hypothetical protein [Rhizobium leguminosarum]NKK01057.1 hypothetical protein [Rhizobium leguminosarum bv. viciae]
MSTRSQLSWNDLAMFEIDDDARLYWKGEAVVLEKRLKLEAYQVWLASLATFGTLLSGIHPFGQSFGWW